MWNSFLLEKGMARNQDAEENLRNRESRAKRNRFFALWPAQPHPHSTLACHPVCQGDGTAKREIQGLIWWMEFPFEKGLLLVFLEYYVWEQIGKQGLKLAFISLLHTYCQHLLCTCLWTDCVSYRNLRPEGARISSLFTMNPSLPEQCLVQASDL